MAFSADVDQLQAEMTRLKQGNYKWRASNRRWIRIEGTEDLTGLPNKVFFCTVLLPQVVTQHNAEGRSFAGIMLVPDDLGKINRKYGREGGDRIVAGCTEYLKENQEPGEKLIHVDGTNFVPYGANAGAVSAKRRIRQIGARIVSRHFQCGGDAISVTLSMGVTIRASEPEDTEIKVEEVAENLLERMGIALDEANKQGGDAAVEHFEEE